MFAQKTYPEDYSCILQPQGQTGGLYIGNLQAAQNINTLKKHSIKAVLTAAKGIDLNHQKQLIPYMLYIPADDHQSFNISTYFDKAADFIASAIEKTNVMVHCLAGVSRSVSLVLSYFIKYRSYTYDEAFNLVKSKRRIIHPNDGFIAQLKTFASRQGTTQRKRSPEPQHHYSASPQKSSYNNYVAPEISQLRRVSLGTSLKKHFSINQTLNQEVQPQSKFDYKKYQGILSNQDNKYQILAKDPKNYQIFGRIKRMSSLNVPTLQVIQNQRRQVYGIFNNIENKQSPSKISSNVSDIDKKIEQIRKKYSDISGYQMSYSNHKGLTEDRTNGENKYTDKWSRQDIKRDYKYLPQYENIVKNRQYHQYRPISSHLYSRDS